MPTKKLISVGELIDQTWEVFRGQLSDFLAVSSWLLITAILYTISLALYPSVQNLQFSAAIGNTAFSGVILYAFTTYLLAPFLSFLIYLALTRLSASAFSRSRTSHNQALKEGWNIFLPALLTTIMVGLMLVLALVIGFAPPAIIAGIGTWLSVSGLVLIGNLLLLFGIFVSLYLSIQWTTYYFFAPIVTILDDVRGKKALEISRKLVAGRFWGILARIAVPKLVFLSFGIFAMTILAYSANIMIDASAGLNLDLQLRLTTMFNTIIPIVIVVLINPLIVISDVLLFRSLKETRS